MGRGLHFDEAHHLRHRVLGRDGDTSVTMIQQHVAFCDVPCLSFCCANDRTTSPS